MPRPTNGTAVQQWGTNPNTAQQFAILSQRHELEDRDESTPTSASARPATAPGTHRDRDPGLQRRQRPGLDVTLVSGTTDTFNFKNVASNRCMDVSGFSTADGARMQLYDCTGGNNQKFAVNVN